jgi:aryl-alcohol dehydrogenase-like predicted oxidoreductase/adenylate kinase family enzyme
MTVVSWPESSERRIGLGCMRLATADQVVAAVQAGLTIFDTARAYGECPGDNERLLAGALRACGAEISARIVTKGGMTRPEGRWLPDGRAKAIAADCEASLVALDGLPIDLYLIHAPDQRTPWATSVRALARIAEQGLARNVGVANVTRQQLDEAMELAPIAAVQVAVSPFDDRALRGGVVDRCSAAGITVIAHSPLGGPKRAGRLARRKELVEIAVRHGGTPAEVALAWLLGLAPRMIPIPGARRPETLQSALRAAALDLGEADRAVLDTAFGAVRKRARARRSSNGEVVIVMGIPGAGKTRVAADYVARGHVRLNRDERGGSLRALVDELDEQLATGARRAVLDNTYLTRAARSRVVETAARHGLAARCVWLDTPLAQAQANLVERLLARFDSLPTPEQIREASRAEPWLMLPTSQMRAVRELEPPTIDEGFSGVERVPFQREASDRGGGGVFIAAAAVGRPTIEHALDQVERDAPHLLFDWIPGGSELALAEKASWITRKISGRLEVAVCPHGGGPPSCWCRPPLPGLPLGFARAYSIDTGRSTLIGCSAAHRSLASTIGARYLEV